MIYDLRLYKINLKLETLLFEFIINKIEGVRYIKVVRQKFYRDTPLLTESDLLQMNFQTILEL